MNGTKSRFGSLVVSRVLVPVALSAEVLHATEHLRARRPGVG